MSGRLTYLLYNSSLTIAAPVARVWLRMHAEHRLLLERFAPAPPQLGDGALWVHACSVGEVNTARPILAALKKRFPETPCLLTSSTATGFSLASGVKEADAVAWCPFDTRAALRRFLDAVRPRALVLVETEIWPNMLRECRRRGILVLIVNGRLSDKHFARYQRRATWLRPVFAQVSAVGVQNDAYAERFVALGVAPESVAVTGNTKFDGVATTVTPRIRSRLRAELGWGSETPVLVFGSTRPGDEALAAACWARLSEEFPELRLAVAPRHLDRAGEAAACFGEEVARRSLLKANKQRPGEHRVLIVDTLGELVSFYAIATIAVIGGSFYPGVNGHNPLEAAALGVPTVFGPFMSNFPDPARALTEANGAIQVPAPEALCDTLSQLLRDAAQRRHLGTRGRKAILAEQGAIARNVELIARELEKTP